jgi:hypothetical protein
VYQVDPRFTRLNFIITFNYPITESKPTQSVRKNRTIPICLGGIFLLLKCAVLLLALLLLNHQSYSQLSIDHGKSFVNVSKGTNGGTVEPGDTLQIRATFVVSGSGTNDYVDSCAFFDVIPANTTYIKGTLAILTNEGMIYKTFTDTTGDDDGSISGTSIRINMGYKNNPTATAFRRGRIKYNDKPSFFGATCIMVASYKVKVTGAYNAKINIGGGSISYLPFGGSLSAVNFNQDSVMIFQNLGLCSNSSGSNAIQSEFGGTFGSGKAKNRTPSSNVPASYTYSLFGANAPEDYYYGISNNTSTGGVGYTTLNTWAIPDANIGTSGQSHRVFNVWDIIGDHTGAASQTAGNPATDTVNGTGGYMVVINSSYRTDTAFLDTVANLCPNTYYQYYAWFRNICSHCGCDSNGVAPGTTGYIPTGPGDSSGVHPNMTFSINGYDYYTTGNIVYSGQWVKKGFTYLTGPGQTSMIINVRNNAPGGGGNDWAIDDIGVATCAPSISLTPNKPDTLCMGADDTVSFKVASFFNNITQWELQQSVNGGATWTSPGTDTAGQAASGSATAVYNPLDGLYEYLITRYYRLNDINSLVEYRLTVATTTTNLSNANCSYIGSSSKLIYAVNCQTVLLTSLIFKGQLQEGLAQLQWISSYETQGTRYLIERSDDQQHYTQIGIVNGNAGNGLGSAYSFTDPRPVDGPTYYRINITDNAYSKFSNIVLLSNTAINFDIKSLVNPFTDVISFNMTVPQDGPATYTLVDLYGRIIQQERQNAVTGWNSVQLYPTCYLPSGTYILQIQYGDQRITKKLVKAPN